MTDVPFAIVRKQEPEDAVRNAAWLQRWPSKVEPVRKVQGL